MKGPIPLLAALVIVLLPLALHAQSRPGDFRFSTWGMTPDEVKGLEPAAILVDGSDELIYEATVAGIPCKITYGFFDGRLTRGQISFDSATLAADGLITGYTRLQSLLGDKYGDPLYGPDSTIKPMGPGSNSEDREQAVRSGTLAFYTLWQTPTTQVSLLLGKAPDRRGKPRTMLYIAYREARMGAMRAEPENPKRKQLSLQMSEY